MAYTLLINDEAAKPDLVAAIQQIEVDDNADMADMLRMRIAIGVKEGCGEWTVLDDNVFPRLAKIRLLVTVGSGPPEPLLEAYVIETNVDISNQPGQSVLNVVAMDPTVQMDLEQRVRAWKNMADSDIATQVFKKKPYDFEPRVKQTQPSREEVETITVQRGTDIQFLRQLAKRNGYECYVEINPSTGVVEGHFHPPRLETAAQNVLSVNLGEHTNVNTFTARYDMLRPTTVAVTGLDVETRSDQSAKAEKAALTDLGADPSLRDDKPRRVLLSQTGLSQTGELQTYAQAVVDRSSMAITAEGELNTIAYGGLLRAKRLVEVRGVGTQFSGTYYVAKVHHVFSGDGYTQRFTLRSNALGLTGKEGFGVDDALPS